MIPLLSAPASSTSLCAGSVSIGAAALLVSLACTAGIFALPAAGNEHVQS